jgi:transposase
LQYIGFDIHKQYTFYTQMNASGQIQRHGKLPNTREAMAEFFADVAEPAHVAMEATMNWYHLYDLLEVLHIPVTLAHPLRTRAIAEAKVKTDKIDSTILAHLLRADLVPAAYIPPREIRDLRELLRYRASLVRLQTAVKNRVHAVLLKHGYQCPVTDVFGKKGRAWLATLPLRSVYQQVLQGFLQVLDTLREQIKTASHLVDEQARATPVAQTLCTLPGIGHYTALLLLAEIGDVHRFPDPKHLVSYAGLAPSVHASGGHVHTGHISKQGSSWLRWILIEAAHHAARKPGRCQQLYRRLERRKGPKIASVAVARELLTTVYWMLRHVS